MPVAEQQAVAAELKKLRQARSATSPSTGSAGTPTERQRQPYPLDDTAADKAAVEEMLTQASGSPTSQEMLAQAELDIQNFCEALHSADMMSPALEQVAEQEAAEKAAQDLVSQDVNLRALRKAEERALLAEQEAALQTLLRQRAEAQAAALEQETADEAEREALAAQADPATTVEDVAPAAEEVKSGAEDVNVKAKQEPIETC